MKISAQEKNSLIVALTEIIALCKWEPLGYVAISLDAEKRLSAALEEDVVKKLETILDDGGIRSFVQRYVIFKLYKSGFEFPVENVTGPSVPITELEPFSNALIVAKDMADEILSFPWQYEICVQAISSRSGSWPLDMDIQISRQLRLVSRDIIKGQLELSHPDPFLNKKLCSYATQETPIKFGDDKSAYFVYRTSGFQSDRSSPKIVADFYDEVRAFYGASIAFGLIEDDTWLSFNRQHVVIVNKIDDNVREFAYSEYLESDVQLATNIFEAEKYWSLEDTAEDISKKLRPIVKMFMCSDAQRMRTSAIWLLRSYLADRGMDKILDATISIEVLLGDRESSDRIGLSKLMANRCAYSLGKSHTERKELEEFFKRFYKLRSDIVHAGRLKVSKEESAVVTRGINLAARIFRHEVDLQ